LVPFDLGGAMRRIDDGPDSDHMGALRGVARNRTGNLFLLQPKA